jgi:hypothetical protein
MKQRQTIETALWLSWPSEASSHCPSSEILGDDARLAAEQPAHTNSLRPGAIEYGAFSAVGFNAAKTKALVYVRNRTAQGLFNGMGMWELKAGRWISGSRSCGGVA